MSVEQLRLRPTAPMHELFNFAKKSLFENPNTYSLELNKHNLEYFSGLRERVVKGKRSVRRFDKTMKLLQAAVVDANYKVVSMVSYPKANEDIRQILYLLTWGYLRQTLGDKNISIDQIIKNNNNQLAALALNLNRPIDKITIAELANAVMRGDFLPAFLSEATPLRQK